MSGVISIGGCNSLPNSMAMLNPFSALIVPSASSTPTPSPGPSINPSACDEGDTGSGYLPISGPLDLIAVDATKTVRTICEDFHGINDSPAYDPLWADPSTTRAVAPLNFSVAREWGGSGVNWINFTQFPSNMPAWAPQPDQVWNVVKNHAKKMLWQTNSTTIGGNDPGGAPVGAMVAYFKSKAIPLQAIEIGNENDNSSAQDFLPTSTYNQVFTDQCLAAKHVDPTSKCMGPVSTNEWYWWPTNGGSGSPNTLEKFLQATGNLSGNGTVDKVSLHWYPGYKLDTMTTDFTSFWPLIRNTLKRLDTRNLPVYFTEVSSSSQGVENAWIGSALQAADMIEGMALHGVGGYDYFTIHHVNPPFNFGFLNSAGEGKQNSASPTYYSLYLVRQMGSALLNITQGRQRNLVSAYASKRNDGSLQVMAINKTGTPQSMRISFSGYSPLNKLAHLTSLVPATVGSVSSTSVLFNGVIDPSPESLPPPTSILISDPVYSFSLPAYSIYLIDLNAN